MMSKPSLYDRDEDSPGDFGKKFHSLVEWKAVQEQKRKETKESSALSDEDYGRIAEAEFRYIYDNLVGSPSMDNGVQIDLGEL